MKSFLNLIQYNLGYAQGQIINFSFPFLLFIIILRSELIKLPLFIILSQPAKFFPFYLWLINFLIS